MLKPKFPELITAVKQSGLIGIGISLTFMLSFYGLTLQPQIWLVYILFGGLVGMLIGLANSGLDLLFRQKLPDASIYILVKLILSYILSCLIFYFTGLAFSLLLTIPQDYLVYISIAVGIPSAMVNLFFTFLSEKEAKIKLEQENKELAIMEERNRIARELHDSVSQNLFGISLNLETLEHILTTNPQQAPEIIEQLQNMVQEVQTEMRLMIYELKPLTFQERGFLEAVNNLIDLFEKRYNLNINFNSNCQQEQKLNQEVKLNLYRIIQETLHNIVQHAQAEEVTVNLKINNEINLLIADDGVGFNQKKADAENNFGLHNIKERALELNGNFTIDSQKNEGTRIIITIPGGQHEAEN